ncbi:ParA family protein [Halalkalicoccus jeotgali]|uniref:Cobyrinic acid ac-diamide synthase n=1 Tax=Halalkalicoccus jeotgali (strain DSM 18796 / CECT 7217 / JCM 14584 / KCTC 4019 / B3) TaxID=795797 RepID=D8JC20_HALJB|nr:ParA family protein [Halalkalicoccus jeotgali]ADJ16927.1 Cobyrinic acid ac-diamide synthase [Halalkalicoccus jeotgali B3]ELY38636.1 Cobyrinic acid ac-diamide synthase [Halalkalicoccus jeotgali B3]
MSTGEFEGLPGAAISLLKGGVGKSTIALNIADRLAARGHETVLIDLDKDGHMTTQLGYDDAYDRDTNLGDAVIDGEDPRELLIETEFGVYLLPSNDDLENVETRLKDERFADVKLRRNVVEPLIQNGFDYVIIDAAGGRGKLSDNALIAVQRVIIPLIPRAGSINGLNKMIGRQISPIRENIGLDILAVTPNMIRETMGQHNEHRILVENLNREFGSFVPKYAQIDPDIFDALDDPERSIDEVPKPGIRERTAISRAFKQGLPVSEFDEDCDQIPNFDYLADLVEEHSHD